MTDSRGKSTPWTPEALEQFKLKARVLFLELVVQQLLKQMATRQAPDDPALWLQRWAEDVRAKSKLIAFPGLPAVTSDMMAAEYQEAVDDFMQQLLPKP